MKTETFTLQNLNQLWSASRLLAISLSEAASYKYIFKKVNVHAALREARSDALGFELPCEPPGSVRLEHGSAAEPHQTAPAEALWAAKRTKLSSVGSARGLHRFSYT